LVKGQGSPELIPDYGAQEDLSIRPRCIGTIRAQTQCDLSNLSIYETGGRKEDDDDNNNNNNNNLGTGNTPSSAVSV